MCKDNLMGKSNKSISMKGGATWPDKKADPSEIKTQISQFNTDVKQLNIFINGSTNSLIKAIEEYEKLSSVASPSAASSSAASPSAVVPTPAVASLESVNNAITEALKISDLKVESSVIIDGKTNKEVYAYLQAAYNAYQTEYELAKTAYVKLNK